MCLSAIYISKTAMIPLAVAIKSNQNCMAADIQKKLAHSVQFMKPVFCIHLVSGSHRQIKTSIDIVELFKSASIRLDVTDA